MYKGKVLIVDENEAVLTSLHNLLSRYFETVRTECNPNILPSLLRKESYELYILAMDFSAGMTSGNEGIYWMKKIHEISPSALVFLIMGYADIPLAVKAIKEGATDLIQKPWVNDSLVATIQKAYLSRTSQMDYGVGKALSSQPSELDEPDYDFISGTSATMRKVLDTICKVAETDANVLICGENGSGKEVLAKEIHRRSRRQKEIFLSVDMGSISPTLFESELFGHLKGAFTDAKEDRPGRFVLASRGTLFLDEIGNLPLELQSKLLGVLQARQVVPVGSGNPIPIDIRLITASNRQLYQLVKDHLFREDLLYRINTIEINVPPLRERREDIIVFARHFLQRFALRYKREELVFHPRAIRRLMDYHWPGNIRQLEHFIEKIVILTDRKSITLDDFPFGSEQEIPKEPSGNYNLEENEKILIRKALRKHDGNISASAQELGISRKTLYNKMAKYRF